MTFREEHHVHLGYINSELFFPAETVLNVMFCYSCPRPQLSEMYMPEMPYCVCSERNILTEVQFIQIQAVRGIANKTGSFIG